MQNTAIVDAGPLIALFDSSDKHHKQASGRLKEFRLKHKGKLITTWPVIAEVCALLHGHVHLEAQIDFMKWIVQGGVGLFDLNVDCINTIVDLQEKYDSIPMDFADATLVVLAERTGISKIFSVDEDFSIYRILSKKKFENLMH